MSRRNRAARCAPMVLVLLLASSVAVAATPPDDPPRRGERTPAIGGDDPRWRAGARADEQRATDRRSPAKASDRAATRRRYRDMRAADAVALARRKFPEQLEGRLFDGSRPAAGMAVVDQRGHGTALVRDRDTNRRLLLDSSLPLRVAGPGGYRPVDLALVRGDAGLTTPASLAPLRIREVGAADVALLGTGVQIGLVGAADRRATVVEGRALFANVRTDTDAGVIPQATGAEVFLQLRSDESPERFEFALSLPSGATVRRAVSSDPIPGDPPEALEIARGGEPLAYVYPPLTVDTEGREVRTEMSLQRGRIVLDVEHRGEDLAYPLAVDPEVRVYGGSWNDWPRWWWGQVHNVGGDGTTSSGGFGSAKNDCAYYCPGLYQSHPTNTYITNGSYGVWYYRAPGNTFIYRTQFGGMAHNPVVIYGGHHTQAFQGIMNRAYTAWEGNVNYVNQGGGWGPNPFGPASHAYWGVDHDFCFNPRCDWRAGEEMNYALFGLVTQNAWGCCGVQTYPEKGTTTMAWSNVYLGDRQRPWLIEGTPGSRDWYDDGFATRSLSVRARDNGLGIYGIRLRGAASGNATRRHGCTGHPDWSPCPWDWTQRFDYTLAEGTNTLSVDAHDAVDNYTPTHTWTEKVDRSQPRLSPLGGSMHDARNRDDDHRYEVLDRDSYVLTATATDGGSGVREIEVFMNGESQRSRGGYAAGGSLSWTLRPDDLPDGTYTVDVVARDNVQGQPGAPDARHVDQRSFEVTIDRRGDVHVAREFDGDPHDGGFETGFEAHPLGTTLARRETEGALSTRHVVSCGEDGRLCGETRYVQVGSDSGEAQADQVSVQRGDSPDDPRLDAIASIAELARADLGEPVATGAIHEILRPSQRPPSGHGDTFEVFEHREEAEVDERDQPIVRRIYRDAVTKLVLRERLLVGDDVEMELFYRYGRDRVESASLPGDYFAAASSDPDAATESTDLGSEPRSEPPEEEPVSTDVPLADALEFRRAYDLNTDLTFVQTVLDEPEYQETIGEYGVPLTPAEEAELDERDKAADAIVDVINAYGASAAPATYAGAWVDNANDGVVRVMFTADADQHLDNLKARYPYPARLRVSTVTRTLDELQALEDRIGEDVELLRSEGIEVTVVYLDLATNSVKVGVPLPTPDQELRLQERYGPGAKLEQQAAFAHEQYSERRVFRRIPPVLAGLHIFHTAGTGANCSTAFSVRRGRRYRVLTAAHCSRVRGRVWRHWNGSQSGERIIGFNSAWHLGNFRDSKNRRRGMDVGQIAVLRRRYTTNIAYLWPGNGRGAFQRIRRQATLATSPRGKTICTLGFTFDRPACGPLRHSSATIYTEDGPLYRMGVWDPESRRTRGGDSGGGVLRYDTALGVHQGSNGPLAAYTPMSNVTQRFGTRVITRDP